MIKVILKEHVLKETYAVPLSKSGLPPIAPVSLKASYSWIIWKLRAHTGYSPLPYPYSIFHKSLPISNISQICPPFSISTISILVQATIITCLDEKQSTLLASCLLLSDKPFFLWQPEFFRNIHLVITYLFKTIQ